MISIQGTLVVKSILGSRGRFAVGELSTSIGTFKVKDAVLDQFDEGTYQGTFVVTNIGISSYTHGGRFVNELRAKVADVMIASEDSSDVPPPPPLEHDPIDELAAAATAPTPVWVPEPLKPELAVDDTTPSTTAVLVFLDEIRVLFDEVTLKLMSYKLDVKLDPTVDRELFRKQRDALKTIGYTFQVKTQVWIYVQH